jgi:hypothetical protein
MGGHHYDVKNDAHKPNPMKSIMEIESNEVSK